jgi:uncharacterized protein
MKLIDMHSHWATERGYALQTPAERQLQHTTWRSEPKFATEEQMAADFHAAGVEVILDFGFTKFLPVEHAAALHDYAFETQRRFPDVIIGNWFHFQPELGKPVEKEFRRCLDANAGFAGLCASGAGGVPATDPAYFPLYKMCIEAKVPALIIVGHTGLGAGMPGGMGIILDHCHPRHLDIVAARFPELTIIAARPAWPWQSEMISIMLHKPNVWCELHGWSPKYFTHDLKHDLARRLQDRMMFGADYPLLSYQRLINDWRELGLSEAILEKVFRKNAERLFETLGWDLAKRQSAA